MPPTAEPPIDDKTKLEPEVQKIIESMNLVLEPEKPAEGESVGTSLTLGEAAVIANDKAKEEAAKTPEAKAKEESDRLAKEESDKAAADKAKGVPVTPAPAKLKRKEVPQPTAPVVAAPAKVEPPVPKPEEVQKKLEDDEYVKTLTPEQQEELSIARYAEANGKPGIAGQMVEYFRRVDKYIEEHPDQAQDSAEFTDFLKSNRPKWTETERRQVERKMIADESAAMVRQEFEPEVRENARKLKEIETKPVIEEAVKGIEDAITFVEPKLANETDEQYQTRLAGGLRPIDRAVVDKINADGYEAAVAEFPIEAPIVAATTNATRAWLQLSNRLVNFDENNQTHAWLAGFLAREGQNMKQQPKEVQDKIAASIGQAGKSFLPMNEFIQAVRDDSKAASKFFTFSDDMIVEMIGNNAMIVTDQQIKQLEKAGFKREVKGPAAKVSGQSGSAAPDPARAAAQAAAGTGGSPRAGAKAISGPEDGDETMTENQKYLESLVPGASKVVAGA